MQEKFLNDIKDKIINRKTEIDKILTMRSENNFYQLNKDAVELINSEITLEEKVEKIKQFPENVLFDLKEKQKKSNDLMNTWLSLIIKNARLI